MPLLDQPPGDRKPRKINGSHICRGDLDASLIDVFGHLHVDGNLTTARLKLQGECSIGGLCTAQEITSLGSLRVNNLQAERITANGYLSVTRDAAAAEFTADGCVRIGSLSCLNSFRIKLSALSRINRLTAGGEITVMPSSKLLNRLMSPLRSLRCDTIEGADVTLYRTQAASVTGENVTVGPGCVIQEIRYSGVLTIHPRAQVGKSIMINSYGGIIK
ncbi:hypothetical protein [Paenibacillus sp. MMS20-IR301]|uniref:hypothetical protein n=1 Tax=Paenibacillus sp. MMS20-IR301 TaxID=2895946 RepID=UPI0028E79DE7|nr:hypothetical protein [Paenibacillus sp. MMS20-IR301]WNS46412.1 hypothetical protein LOS79_14505 [Paenibacillus sp. MMS20-IR301]